MNNAVPTFTCRLCGSHDATQFLKTRDRYAFSAGDFHLYRCSRCGLVSIHPFPDEKFVKSAYPEKITNPFLYFQNTDKDFLEHIYSFFHPYSVKWRMAQVEKAVGTGRLLDVNCGNGRFLYELRQHLWEVAGVESRADQAGFARETMGLKVYASLTDLEEKYKNSFDVITFWHNFGQFSDFKKILQLTVDLLHPGGYILLALPNWKSLDFGFYRQHWAALDVPRRFFHFSPRQVQLLAARHYLKVQKSKVIPFDIYYNSLLSEKIIMENSRASRVFKAFRYSRSLFVAIIAHIFSLAGTGSGMLYFLRRKERHEK